MKRTVTFTVGIIIFAAASAIGKSDQPNANTDAAAAEFGQLSVENLTAEQRAILQSKFRYWNSSGTIEARAPI
jgi:hypothetical protein